MSEKLSIIIVLLLILGLLTFVGWAVNNWAAARENFKEVCIERGGVALYNGRNLECIK